jgi:hypothetical protein
MRQLGILSLIVGLAAASGCNLCCWGKRNAELTGPTDIRKGQAWCLGEDAVFHQPMGPSRNNYGLKPTCWREWPAGGAACADGSCGPVLTPGTPMRDAEPTPHWDQTPHPEIQDANPFLDDAQPLPSPAAGGANRTLPSLRRGTAEVQPKEFQSLFKPQVVPPRRTATRRPTNQPTVKPKLPPRVVSVSPVPKPSPDILRQVVPAAASANPDRLHITVSDVVDAPVRTLSPIAAPNAASDATSADAAIPDESKAMLASLERMIDLPLPTSSEPGPGPAVIRNDYATPPEPFRLATRGTLAHDKQDPELAKQTLSALGSMMSDAPDQSGSSGSN